MTDDESTTFNATGAAFIELRDAVIARSSAEIWLSIASAVSCPATIEEGAWYPETTWIEALHQAEEQLGAEGAIARAVGLARGESVMRTERVSYDGDPLRFLKLGAGLFYRDRANYGATSLEMTPKKAIVRFVFPGHFTQKRGEVPNRGPLVVLAFLEHAIAELGGGTAPGRYTGHAKRADTRFNQPLYNQHYEFDLEENEGR